MQLDEIDITILKQAIQHPGANQKSIYGPLLGAYAESTLFRRVKSLAKLGFLDLNTDAAHTIKVFATRKAVRQIGKLERGDVT